MARWGMVIDLKKCIGCWGCVVACKEEHFLPRGVFWNRVLTGETGKFPTVVKQMYPVLCNHCKDAACVKVCPTGATSRREDGIVLVDYDKCIGCRYCLVSCPYQQRTFYDSDKAEYYPGQGLITWEILGRKLYPLQKGTVIKCTFCVERLDEGIKKGLTPGIDRDASPACVIACPVGARTFGNLDDPFSDLSRLLKEGRGSQIHPEFGTDPSVYYLS